MQKRHDRSHLFVVAFFSMTLLAAGKGAKDYRDEALKVTKEVETFVARECIKGSDLEKVHKIIEVTHDKFLFPRVDRDRMETWLKNPDKAEEFRNSLEKQKTDLRRLYEKRITHLLSAEEDKQRQELQQAVFIGEHDLRVFNEVIRKKDISPLDIPFAVSGAEAVVYGITDGCTTAAKTFIVLAQAAGLKETRYVATGNVPDYNLACISKGQPRRPEITINGHFFALVKIEGRWALVNCTYYNPYSEDDEIRYEIFFNLDGQEVNPDMLKLRILRIPSFQRDAGGTLPPPNRLYVIAVGKDSQDDLDIENYNALMNLSVSGDRNCPECKYNRF
jgi:hypothetical protein